MKETKNEINMTTAEHDKPLVILRSGIILPANFAKYDKHVYRFRVETGSRGRHGNVLLQWPHPRPQPSHPDPYPLTLTAPLLLELLSAIHQRY